MSIFSKNRLQFDAHKANKHSNERTKKRLTMTFSDLHSISLIKKSINSTVFRERERETKNCLKNYLFIKNNDVTG